MKFRFIFPSGRTQITDATNQSFVDYINACLSEHPLEQDAEGRYIVTDPDLFNELMDNAPEH